jgi:hypothetical protein
MTYRFGIRMWWAGRDSNPQPDRYERRESDGLHQFLSGRVWSNCPAFALASCQPVRFRWGSSRVGNLRHEGILTNGAGYFLHTGGVTG